MCRLIWHPLGSCLLHTTSQTKNNCKKTFLVWLNCLCIIKCITNRESKEGVTKIHVWQQKLFQIGVSTEAQWSKWPKFVSLRGASGVEKSEQPN